LGIPGNIGAERRLDLALLVDTGHQRLLRRVKVEATTSRTLSMKLADHC
jgi:hypothetical protein